ncbi:hypothetical protein AKJ16_DCAP11898, partial [Drosera capensis]
LQLSKRKRFHSCLLQSGHRHFQQNPSRFLDGEAQRSTNDLLMEAPQNPQERPPPPGTSRLPGTVNWGTATSKDAEVMLKLGSTPDKKEQHRLMRDAMEKRFIQVTRGSIVGGVRLGIFTAAFYGLQDLLAEKRGVHDAYGIVAAGSATAATFGVIMPGSVMWRARNVLLGSVLGAAFGFPLGWAHLKLVEKANEQMQTANSDSHENGQVKSGVKAFIGILEGTNN